MLLNAAERSGIVMLAEIAMRRALNAGKPDLRSRAGRLPRSTVFSRENTSASQTYTDHPPTESGTTMITKDEARRMVLAEWRPWATTNVKRSPPNGMDGLMFFAHLQNHHPDLLRFRDRGDRWQTVHGWLLRDRLVAD
jgi:hypothetical protein